MQAAQAEMLGQRGEVDQALKMYNTALPVMEAAAPSHPQLMEALCAAYATEGLLLQRSGRGAEGVTRLQLAFHTLVDMKNIRTPVLPAHVLGALIDACIRENDADAAEELCEEALAMPMFATSPVPRFMLGTLGIFKGDLDGALDDFTLALKVDPLHAPSMFNIGNVYLRKHTLDADPSHLERAVDMCEQAIRVDNKAVHAWLFSADALLRLGRHKQGLHALHEALKLDPNFGGAHSLLGAHLATQERFEEAVTHLRASMRQGDQALPELRERDHTVLIMCLMRLGKPAEALAVANDLVQLMPHVDRYRQLQQHLRTLTGASTSTE